MASTDLQKEVTQAIITLGAIASAAGLPGFGDAYKQVGINYSLEACAIVAEITGYDATFCKMMNHKFRTDAAAMMFARAA